MTTNKTLGWFRTLALGGALLIGAATLAGPAAADEIAFDGSCLNDASVGFSLIDEQGSAGFEILEQQDSAIGLTALDEQDAVSGLDAIDNAASASFDQADQGASACGR